MCGACPCRRFAEEREQPGEEEGGRGHGTRRRARLTAQAVKPRYRGTATAATAHARRDSRQSPYRFGGAAGE